MLKILFLKQTHTKLKSRACTNLRLRIVKNNWLSWLGVQAYLSTQEAGAHWLSVFWNQMWMVGRDDKVIKVPGSLWAIYVNESIIWSYCGQRWHLMIDSLTQFHIFDWFVQIDIRSLWFPFYPLNVCLWTFPFFALFYQKKWLNRNCEVSNEINSE